MDTNNSTTDRSRIRRYYLIMFFVKAGLGIGLLICGIQGVRYTQGQDMFGPPYYVGGFAAGSCLILASIFAVANCRLFSGDDHTMTKSTTAQLVMAEIVFTVLAGFSCFFGIFFVAAFGLKGCDNPSSFAHGCNYTANISQNKNIAVVILIGLLMTVVIVVISIFKVCCSPLLGAYRANNRTRFTFHAQAAPVTTYNYTTAGQAGGQPTYHYPTATVGMPGTQSNITYLNSDPGSSNPGAQPADNQVRNLEEQNRLLREQLELQTRLQQQQQPYPTQNFPAPPPPSYTECVSNPEKADMGFSGASEPSAPPL